MHSNHHPSQFEEYLTNGKEFRQSKTRYQKLSSSSIQIMQKIKAERSKLYCRSTQDNSPVNSHLQRQFQLAIRVRDDDTLWRMAIQRLTITYPVPCQHCWKTLFTKVHQEDIDSASSAAAHNSNALSMIPPIVHCKSCRSAWKSVLWSVTALTAVPNPLHLMTSSGLLLCICLGNTSFVHWRHLWIYWFVPSPKQQGMRKIRGLIICIGMLALISFSPIF